MDYRAIPSDADVHYRTKWSRDLFIFIDDDAGAPSLYMFDRSGKPVFSAMIQIAGVDRMRVHDFAASPDGTVWVGGLASSLSGQQSFFLAHLGRDGQEAQIVQTNPYIPWRLSVAQDGSVWTVGYEVKNDVNSGTVMVDRSRNALRHFDASGKLIASAIPASTVGISRILSGHLVAGQDRLGWYSPETGGGTYVEFSLNMNMMNSYTGAPTADNGSLVPGFALTTAGNVFVVVDHPKADERASVLYELDRGANKWMAVDGLPRNKYGSIPELEGNDGESLVFSGPPEKSKLQIFQVPQLGH